MAQLLWLLLASSISISEGGGRRSEVCDTVSSLTIIILLVKVLRALHCFRFQSWPFISGNFSLRKDLARILYCHSITIADVPFAAHSLSSVMLRIFSFLSSLAFLAFATAQGDLSTCSATKPCFQGCCSHDGNCGFTPQHCGTGCVSNCDAKAECGQYASSNATDCPINVCCR